MSDSSEDGIVVDDDESAVSTEEEGCFDATNDDVAAVVVGTGFVLESDSDNVDVGAIGECDCREAAAKYSCSRRIQSSDTAIILAFSADDSWGNILLFPPSLDSVADAPSAGFTIECGWLNSGAGGQMMTTVATLAKAIKRSKRPGKYIE